MVQTSTGVNMTELRYNKYFGVFFGLLAIHSCLVGIGLLVMPDSLISFFGFNNVTERFFPSQGGVFHIIMAAGYSIAAIDLKKYEIMVLFSLIVKMTAALFLFVYYFFIDAVWLVLLSGFTDLIMGIIILLLYKKILNKAVLKKVYE